VKYNRRDSSFKMGLEIGMKSKDAAKKKRLFIYFLLLSTLILIGWW